MKLRRALFLVFAFPFLVGLFPAFAQQGANPRIGQAISQYENGEYLTAVDSLKKMLPGLQGPDRATAYKYLAYSYAMLHMGNTGKKYFKRLLKEFPKEEIDTVLVAPQIVKIYRQARNQVFPSEATSASVTDKPASWPWIASLSLGVASGGGGGAALYLGIKDYDTYSKLPQGSPDFDKFRSRYQLEYNLGYALLGVSGVSLAYTGYRLLFVRNRKARGNAVLLPLPDGFAFSMSF